MSELKVRQFSQKSRTSLAVSASSKITVNLFSGTYHKRFWKIQKRLVLEQITKEKKEFHFSGNFESAVRSNKYFAR
jgi:hypothetical protein